MQIATGIVVYFMIWWIVLLIILPIGYKPQETVQTGNAQSAPKEFKFKKKALLTSAISLLLFMCIYFLIEENIFSFRSLVAADPKW